MLLAVVACGLVPTAPAFAADQDLDVRVDVVGEEIRSYVSLFVRAPLQRVWEVITDFERAPAYTRDLHVSKVLSRSGNTLRFGCCRKPRCASVLSSSPSRCFGTSASSRRCALKHTW